MSDYQISTDCLHAGYRPGNGEPRNFPIVQSTTFRYETSEEMGKLLFDLEASGYFYTRLQNPTNDTVAAKICALEGGAPPPCCALLRTGGQLLCHLQHRGLRRPHHLLHLHLRWDLQPFFRHHEAHGHRVHLRGSRVL